MSTRKRLLISFLLALPLVVVSARNSLAAPAPTHGGQVVKVSRVGTLGTILVTGKGFALYRWTRERPGQIKCAGECAKVWPPLLLPSGVSAPRSVRGATGTFGIVIRPDKTRQLTYNGHALYTYVSDTKSGEALCQGAEGWYVLQVKGR